VKFPSTNGLRSGSRPAAAQRWAIFVHHRQYELLHRVSFIASALRGGCPRLLPNSAIGLRIHRRLREDRAFETAARRRRLT